VQLLLIFLLTNGGKSIKFINHCECICQVTMKTVLDFFAQAPVFTRKEFTTFLEKQSKVNPATQAALLQYHLKQQHIIRIKRGLFASIPRGSDAKGYPVDPYLIAGKLAKDAVLAYHTALEYHGLAYTVFNKFTFCSNLQVRSVYFQNNAFEAVPFPSALKKSKQELFAVDKVKRHEIEIKVTSLERTFVDIIDQPNRCGGWEEICRSLDVIAILNLSRVIQYTLMLEKATTVAKVGYFLEKMQDKIGVNNKQLTILEKQIPKKPHYLDRADRRDGKFFKRWNLIVPKNIVNQQWEEPGYDI